MDNQFGLDYKYFERWVQRILDVGGFKDYRPHECAREFARMSRAADKDVLLEPEFSRDLHERLRIAESERDALKVELAHMVKLKDELLTESGAARKREPVGWILEKSGCRGPDDCEDYLEFYEIGKVDAEELAYYLSHGRAFQVYTSPVPPVLRDRGEADNG